MTAMPDYRGSHTSPGRDTGSSMDDPTSAFGGDAIYGPDALRIYGSGGPGPNMDDETRAWALRSLDAHRQALVAVVASRGRPDAVVTVYRAVPAGIEEAICPGDWVTPSLVYAEIHGESNLGGWRDPAEYRVCSREVCAGDLFTDGDLCEWGWHPRGGESG